MREGEGTKFTIDRKIFTSDIWFASPWKLKIWIYLLGNANHSPGEFMGIPIKRGQLIRSYRTIQKDCGYMIGYRLKKPSLSTVKAICEGFTKDLRTKVRTVHCGTLFTICNYNELQPIKKHEKNRQPNNDRTMTELNKNDKKVKKKEKILKKKVFGEFNNVLLTEIEFEKLNTEFGKPGTNERIQNVSEYVESKGVKYKSHYATILAWERKNKKQSNAKPNLQPKTYSQAQHADRLQLVRARKRLKDEIEQENSGGGIDRSISLLPDDQQVN